MEYMDSQTAPPEGIVSNFDASAEEISGLQSVRRGYIFSCRILKSVLWIMLAYLLYCVIIFGILAVDLPDLGNIPVVLLGVVNLVWLLYCIILALRIPVCFAKCPGSLIPGGNKWGKMYLVSFYVFIMAILYPLGQMVATGILAMITVFDPLNMVVAPPIIDFRLVLMSNLFHAIASLCFFVFSFKVLNIVPSSARFFLVSMIIVYITNLPFRFLLGIFGGMSDQKSEMLNSVIVASFTLGLIYYIILFIFSIKMRNSLTHFINERFPSPNPNS